MATTSDFEPTKLRKELAKILLITIALGTAFSRLLLLFDLNSLVVRNLIVFPVTYFIFFVCVFFWRKRMERLGPLPSKKELDDKIQDSKFDQKGHNKYTWPFDLIDLGEATIIFVLVIAIVGVIIWIFGEAPAILSEVFFDVGLTASLAQALRKRHNSYWYIGLFRKTIVAFLVFYFASLSLLVFAHRTCPSHKTLTSIVRECWAPKRTMIK